MGRGFERIHRSPAALGEEVYERLVAALVEGTLAPGDRLIQDKLAVELDVSRTPVRDALQRLHVEGVLEPAGRRGYVVRSLSAGDVESIYEARRVIEGHAAALIADAEPEAIASIRKAFETTIAQRPESRAQLFAAGRAIHRAIVQATRNQYLLDFFDAIWSRASIGLAYQQVDVLETHEELVERYRALIDALAAAGTADEARRAMLDHIEEGRARAGSRQPGRAGAERADGATFAPSAPTPPPPSSLTARTRRR